MPYYQFSGFLFFENSSYSDSTLKVYRIFIAQFYLYVKTCAFFAFTASLLKNQLVKKNKYKYVKSR